MTGQPSSTLVADAPSSGTTFVHLTRDHVHLQNRAYSTLGNLFERCVEERLPVIRWQVGTTATLVGECAAVDPDERRAEFETWAAALGLTVWPNKDGSRLCGIATLDAYKNDDGQCMVTVVADFTDEAEDAEVTR